MSQRETEHKQTPYAVNQAVVYELNGERRSGVLRIGLTYVAPTGEACCPVSMDGLHDGLPDIRGGNALQAFLLAVQLIEYLIRDSEKNGGRVLLQDEDGEDVTELSADFYFGVRPPGWRDFTPPR